jgi:hypothetical protein
MSINVKQLSLRKGTHCELATAIQGNDNNYTVLNVTRGSRELANFLGFQNQEKHLG